MISYNDGREMRVGDRVRIEHGRTPAIVTDLIKLAEHRAQWNVTEPGVMLTSPPFGLVFIPLSTFADDPILFVAHGTADAP
jgi:hypothetical protein